MFTIFRACRVPHMYTVHNITRNFIDFVALLLSFSFNIVFFVCRAGSYNMAENRFLMYFVKEICAECPSCV